MLYSCNAGIAAREKGRDRITIREVIRANKNKKFMKKGTFL